MGFAYDLRKRYFSIFTLHAVVIEIEYFVRFYDRALKVEAENPEKVFQYYMHMWNIFYLCYALLPFLR